MLIFHYPGPFPLRRNIFPRLLEITDNLSSPILLFELPDPLHIQFAKTDKTAWDKHFLSNQNPTHKTPNVSENVYAIPGC